MEGTQRLRVALASTAIVVFSLLAARESLAQRAAQCVSGSLPSGASYVIAAPDGWSGQRDELVLLAPGYRFPQDPVETPTLDPGIVDALRGAGVAFAGVSYRKSGLAVKEGVGDVQELIEFFANDRERCGYALPERTWLVGASEGGLIAALVAESEAARPDARIRGAVAACGPVGDFRLQIDYITDFRVVFDALFPGVIPGSAVAIPDEVITSWDSSYVPRIRALLASQPAEVQQLLRITGAAQDPSDPVSIETTVLTLLKYNVGATNDAVQTLGGVPYDNSQRVYAGSGDLAIDALVNANAERVTGDPAALEELATFYATTGALEQRASSGSEVPVVTIHTTADPLVPYFHEPIYFWKSFAAGARGTHLNLPVERYGHCNFTPVEIVGALATLRLLAD